jgi:NTE family protein
MLEYGLILSGGGGRGAYQIGVWKTLEKLGLTRYITAVSGTSVGALNAAMFATVSAQKAERIWESITQNEIANPVEAVGRVIDGVIHFAMSEDKSEGAGELIGDVMKSGLFSREGLIALIEQYGINTALPESDIPCFACCANTDLNRADYFDMRAYSPDIITKLLIASSAIPAAFPPEKIGEYSYRDGGLYDNVPIQPLYNIGFRKFIVSYLSPQTEIELLPNKLVFPDAEFIELSPSEEIYLDGKHTTILNDGTLDFNAESAAKRIALGEKESREALEKYANRTYLT